MRAKWCVALSCLLAINVVAVAQDGKQQSDPQLKWVRNIANDFWTCMRGCDYRQAAGLLSPELSDAAKGHLFGVEGYLQSLTGGFSSATTTSEEMAPDRSEVVFRGTLSGDGPTLEYVLRIAKESNGRWSVRFLRIKQREQNQK